MTPRQFEKNRTHTNNSPSLLNLAIKIICRLGQPKSPQNIRSWWVSVSHRWWWWKSRQSADNLNAQFVQHKLESSRGFWSNNIISVRFSLQHVIKFCKDNEIEFYLNYLISRLPTTMFAAGAYQNHFHHHRLSLLLIFEMMETWNWQNDLK